MSDKHSMARDRLLKKYDAETEGEWDIHGEDSNCDLGGSHHEPFLERVTGRYVDIVGYALTLDGFFAWGSGGSIKSTQKPTKTIPHNFKFDEEARTIALAKKKELQAEIAKLEREFNV